MTNKLYNEFLICQPAYLGAAWKDLESLEGSNKLCSHSGSSIKCKLYPTVAAAALQEAETNSFQLAENEQIMLVNRV
jgi:hypothetical protein